MENMISFNGIYQTKKRRINIMKKQIIKVPSYKTMRHASELTQRAQRMNSRYFIDKKKESKKYLCRGY